jgi:hypothetical protein
MKLPKQSKIVDENCKRTNPNFKLNVYISVNNQRCTDCYVGFYYNFNYEKCLPKNPLCLTSDTFNKCLSCYLGYQLFRDTCVQNITIGFKNNDPYLDNDSNCVKYKNNSLICDICATRYVFDTTVQKCR